MIHKYGHDFQSLQRLRANFTIWVTRAMGIPHSQRRGTKEKKGHTQECGAQGKRARERERETERRKISQEGKK